MASNNYIVRTSNASGVWDFGSSLNNYAQNNDAVAQDISYSLNLLLGNCFFAVTEGINWWGLLGAKSLPAISLAVNSALLQVQGVTGILQSNVTLDPLTRNCTLSYRVQTQYGILNNVFVYSAGINSSIAST